MSLTDHDQEHVDTDKDFLVDPASLDQDDARYVLAVVKLVLDHARNIQQCIDMFQLDHSKFVAMYQAKDNCIAQCVVNAMVSGYIAIYENLANRAGLIMSPGPPELPELQIWLSSQLTLTAPHKLRNLCAHTSNVKPPLRGTAQDGSAFKPHGFFESVQAEMPQLIGELPQLIADMEQNMHCFRTPLNTPPDNSYATNEAHAQELLTNQDQDFLFNDLHQRMTGLFGASEAIDALLLRVESRELDLRQKEAHELSTTFQDLQQRFYNKACTLQQERNQRAAEVVETRNEQCLQGFQDSFSRWSLGGQEPSDFDWGVPTNSAPWTPDGWTPVDTDAHTTQSTATTDTQPSTRNDILPHELLSQAQLWYPSFPAVQPQYVGHARQPLAAGSQAQQFITAEQENAVAENRTIHSRILDILEEWFVAPLRRLLRKM
jgi:hypothetical protein